MNFSRLIPKQRLEQRGRSTQRDIVPKAVRNANIGAMVAGSEVSVIDERGLVSINNFASTVVTSGFSINVDYTSSTEVDVTGSSTTFTLARPAIALFQAHGHGFITPNGSVGNFGGNGLVRLKIDDTEYGRGIMSGGEFGGDNTGGTGLTGWSLHRYVVLTAGTHVVKLTGAIDINNGTPAFRLYNYRISYVVLGS